MHVKVRPKKFLGQHFLIENQYAEQIVSALDCQHGGSVLEIGPGKGVLTDLLMKKSIDLSVIEIDRESISYLKAKHSKNQYQLLEGDCLVMDWGKIGTDTLKVIGNFPYHISSPILFKILEHKDHISEVVCMLQKEVAERVAANPGKKTFGIPSVLIQSWYHVEFLFSVPPEAFYPPPKVTSAVIRLTRNDRTTLPCDEKFFKRIVKQSFQSRRKTLRNALKQLTLPKAMTDQPVFGKRAEQLSVEQFIELTLMIQNNQSTKDGISTNQ